MSENILDDFVKGDEATFEQLLADNMKNIVAKADPMGGTCIYKYFIEKTETEAFNRCLEILCEAGLREFRVSPTPNNKKHYIPHDTTIEWVEKKLKSAKSMGEGEKKWLQAKPMLQNTVDVGISVLFQENLGDNVEVIDLLKDLPLHQFMDALQHCTENILEKALFLTEDEKLNKLETIYGKGPASDRAKDGIVEVDLDFGKVFMKTGDEDMKRDPVSPPLQAVDSVDKREPDHGGEMLSSAADAEPIDKRIGWYRVCLNTIVRKTRDLESDRLRILPMGSRVYVTAIDSEGVRVNICEPVAGWASLRSSNGDTILSLLEEQEPIPPSARAVQDSVTDAAPDQKQQEEELKSKDDKQVAAATKASRSSEDKCFALQLLVKLKDVFDNHDYTWCRSDSWVYSPEAITNPAEPLRDSVQVHAMRMQEILVNLLERQDLVRFHSMVKYDLWDIATKMLADFRLITTVSADVFYRYKCVTKVDIDCDATNVYGMRCTMNDKSTVRSERGNKRSKCDWGQGNTFALSPGEWISQCRTYYKEADNIRHWVGLQIITNKGRKSKWYGTNKEGSYLQYTSGDMKGLFGFNMKDNAPSSVKANPEILNLLGETILKEFEDANVAEVQQVACQSVGHVDNYSMAVWQEVLYRCLESQELLYWAIATLQTTGFWEDVWAGTNSEKETTFFQSLIHEYTSDRTARWTDLVQYHREGCLSEIEIAYKALLFGENQFSGDLAKSAQDDLPDNAAAASLFEIWPTIEHMEGSQLLDLARELVVHWLKLAMPDLNEKDCVAGLTADGPARMFVKYLISAFLDKHEPLSGKDIQQFLENKEYSTERAEKYVGQLFRFLGKNMDDVVKFQEMLPLVDVTGSTEAKLKMLKDLHLEQSESFFAAVKQLSSLSPDNVYEDDNGKTKHLSVTSSITVKLDSGLRNSLCLFGMEAKNAEAETTFKVKCDGAIKFEATVQKDEVKQAVVRIKGHDNMELIVECAKKGENFKALFKNGAVVPVVEEGKMEKSKVRFMNQTTKKFLKSSDDGDFDHQTLFDVIPLQCVDKKWHVEVVAQEKKKKSSGKKSVFVSKASTKTMNGEYEYLASDKTYVNQVNSSLKYWFEAEKKDDPQSKWMLRKYDGSTTTVFESEFVTPVPPASGWCISSQSTDTPFEVPWASANLTRARQIPTGSDGWSYDSSSVPCYFVIKFKKPVKIKEMRMRNGYQDNDCIKQIQFCAMTDTTLDDDFNWKNLNQAVSWDIENQWRFESLRSTSTQSFKPPVDLPVSQYYRYMVETTYGGYPYLKRAWFDTEDIKEVEPMVVCMDKKSADDLNEQEVKEKTNIFPELVVLNSCEDGFTLEGSCGETLFDGDKFTVFDNSGSVESMMACMEHVGVSFQDADIQQCIIDFAFGETIQAGVAYLNKTKEQVSQLKDSDLKMNPDAFQDNLEKSYFFQNDLKISTGSKGSQYYVDWGRVKENKSGAFLIAETLTVRSEHTEAEWTEGDTETLFKCWKGLVREKESRTVANIAKDFPNVSVAFLHDKLRELVRKGYDQQLFEGDTVICYEKYGDDLRTTCSGVIMATHEKSHDIMVQREVPRSAVLSDEFGTITFSEGCLCVEKCEDTVEIKVAMPDDTKLQKWKYDGHYILNCENNEFVIDAEKSESGSVVRVKKKHNDRSKLQQWIWDGECFRLKSDTKFAISVHENKVSLKTDFEEGVRILFHNVGRSFAVGQKIRLAEGSKVTVDEIVNDRLKVTFVDHREVAEANIISESHKTLTAQLWKACADTSDAGKDRLRMILRQPNLLDGMNDAGDTSLGIAIKANNVFAIDKILGGELVNVVPIDTPNGQGRTPYMLAAERCQFPIMEKLALAGASSELGDSKLFFEYTFNEKPLGFNVISKSQEDGVDVGAKIHEFTKTLEGLEVGFLIAVINGEYVLNKKKDEIVSLIGSTDTPLRITFRTTESPVEDTKFDTQDVSINSSEKLVKNDKGFWTLKRHDTERIKNGFLQILDDTVHISGESCGDWSCIDHLTIEQEKLESATKDLKKFMHNIEVAEPHHSGSPVGVMDTSLSLGCKESLIPGYLGKGIAKVLTKAKIDLETRMPGIMYVSNKEGDETPPEPFIFVDKVGSWKLYCRFVDSPCRIDVPECTHITFHAFDILECVEHGISLGNNRIGWNRFFVLPTVDQVEKDKLPESFVKALEDNQEALQNGMLFQRLLECETLDWLELTISELESKFKMGHKLLNKVLTQRIKGQNLENIEQFLDDLCKKMLAELDVSDDKKWEYFSMKFGEDLILSDDLRKNLDKTVADYKIETYRPMLTSMMKYEKADELRAVANRVNFLEFLEHFQKDNLTLMASLEFLKIASHVYNTLEEYTGDCSVLIGKHWYQGEMRGLDEEGKVEVFLKNDTQARFVNFNQIRLNAPYQNLEMLGGEDEPVVCTEVDFSGEVEKTTKWVHATLEMVMDNQAVVIADARPNEKTAVFKVEGAGLDGYFYRQGELHNDKMFYQNDTHIVINRDGKFKFYHGGRENFDSEMSDMRLVVTCTTDGGKELPKDAKWVAEDGTEVPLKIEEVDAKKCADKLKFVWNEESFWKTSDGSSQCVSLKQDSSGWGKWEIRNMDADTVWGDMSFEMEKITVKQHSLQNMFNHAYKGNCNDMAGEIGFEFTALKDFKVCRFARAYEGERLQEEATVTLWDVEKSSVIAAQIVGPDAQITDTHPGWMSKDVAVKNIELKQGKKYRLTQKCTKDMKDKWNKNEPLCDDGVSNGYIEIGDGYRSDPDSSDSFPSIQVGANMHVGMVSLFMPQEVEYTAHPNEKGQLEWSDGDVWTPRPGVHSKFPDICVRLKNAVVPKDSKGQPMQRVIGQVPGSSNYCCSWCGRKNIEIIDRYYHWSKDTNENICFQCFNDKTSYAPLATKMLTNSNDSHFKKIWDCSAATQDVPVLFTMLGEYMSKDKFRKSDNKYVGCLESLQSELEKDLGQSLGMQGQRIMKELMKKHEDLQKKEALAKADLAIRNWDLDVLREIPDNVSFLDLADTLKAMKFDSEVETEKQLACILFLQLTLLRDIVGEPLEVSHKPSSVPNELELIQDLVTIDKELEEEPEADPPKVISQTVRKVISDLFNQEELDLDGDLWLDTLSKCLNNSLVKRLLHLPDEYARPIVAKHFSDVEEKEDVCMPVPVLRAPKLQRMRTFTKVQKLNLEDDKVAALSKKQATLCCDTAKLLDFHTLLELVRHDVHGFGLKGNNSDMSENLLAVTYRTWRDSNNDMRPPETMYHNVMVNIIDKMIEMKMWDSLKYTVANVGYPDALKEKVLSYELIMHLESSVNGPKIIRQIVEAEVTNLQQVKDMLFDIEQCDPERLKTLFGMAKEDRDRVLVLFTNEEELDMDVICAICYSNPALKKLNNCHHQLCQGCYDHINKNKSLCPFCRARF